MTVEPLIIVGDPGNGINPDPIRSAYAKYNTHSHGKVLVDDVRYYALKVGDEVQAQDIEGSNLFPSSTTIVSMTGASISVDETSLNAEQITDAVLTQGDIEIPGCTIDIAANTITLGSRSGFLSPDSAKEISKEFVSFTFKDPGTGMYPLVLPGSLDGYVLNVKVAVVTGTVSDVQLRWFDETFETLTSQLYPYTSGEILDVEFLTQTISDSSLLSATRGLGISFVTASSDATIGVNVILASNLN